MSAVKIIVARSCTNLTEIKEMENIKNTEQWKRGERILNEFHRKMAKDSFEQFLASKKQGDKKNG